MKNKNVGNECFSFQLTGVFLFYFLCFLLCFYTNEIESIRAYTNKQKKERKSEIKKNRDFKNKSRRRRRKQTESHNTNEKKRKKTKKTMKISKNPCCYLRREVSCMNAYFLSFSAFVFLSYIHTNTKRTRKDTKKKKSILHRNTLLKNELKYLRKHLRFVSISSSSSLISFFFIFIYTYKYTRTHSHVHFYK